MVPRRSGWTVPKKRWPASVGLAMVGCRVDPGVCGASVAEGWPVRRRCWVRSIIGPGRRRMWAEDWGYGSGIPGLSPNRRRPRPRQKIMKTDTTQRGQGLPAEHGSGPSSRQSSIDFDRNYCTHYAPKPGSLQSDYCALGCDASQRMKDARDAGEPNMTPCIGGHNTPNVLNLCPKWQRRSLEHAEKRADSIEKMMRRMAVVDPVISAWRKKEPRGKAEVIECPACKGRLHLKQSSYNGHVSAKCETEDCVAFIE